MTTEKMKSITTDQNEIISSIQKLHPQQDDVFLFYIKTDEGGIPLVSLDVVTETADMISDVLGERAAALLLMDKICLFSVDNAASAIEKLENCISYIQEAIDKVRDIENGKSEEPYEVIDVREAQDPSKRVL
mgnify:CR=1 FL=1